MTLTQPNVWTSPAHIRRLPNTGPEWNSVKADADRFRSSPRIILADQNNKGDSEANAAAYAWLRTADDSYRDAVETGLLALIGTEDDDFPGENNSSLEHARNLAACVIAADLIEWKRPSDEAALKDWLRMMLTHKRKDGKSITSTHEKRPNNWGTHAGASRVAIAVYLGDEDEIVRCAAVLRGWLGETSFYNGFQFGELDWQSDKAHPVGVNPPRARIAGHSVDGVLPDDQRRQGAFSWPPKKENYAWEAMQGVVTQAVMLKGQGYDAWSWGRYALGRAAAWLDRVCDFPPEGDDSWLAHVLNQVYPVLALPEKAGAGAGKAAGYADWTTIDGLWPRR